ncbi:MBL fold metallo-hydrolase [Aggregatibacter actinomycetemcomitans]|nr:MBL fold metallo-hydrolase [Aggregatibacter actinomycetemcomitans]
MKKLLLVTALFSATSVYADDLKFHTFNPQENSIFPISSTIVEGDKELLLVDAQFQRNDAETLVSQIKALNKPLKTIYISHFDPDYYFGLDVVAQAFPDAEIIATPETVKNIKQSIIGKVDYWSPILESNAPKALVLPKATDAENIKIGTSHLAIKGKQRDPSHTYLWDKDSQTLLGGVQLYQGMHLWLADSQSKKEREHWLETLEEMQKLQPKKVISGHFIGETSPAVLDFSKQYLTTVEKVLSNSQNSAQVIEKMKKAYPNLKGESDLEMSAKVLKGEMKWPQ